MSAEVKQEIPTQEAPRSNTTEQNLANMRKMMEQEKQARLRAEDEIAKLKQQYSSPKASDDDDDSSDEPYVDHRVFKKKMNNLKQEMESTIDRRAEEKARSLFEQERQGDYVKRNPDFQNILTGENIQKFAEKHPAIAERMLRMPDTFDRQALLYEQIKALESVAKEAAKSSIQDKIDQNRRSPYYQPSGIAAEPYKQVGDFSEAGQKNAYEKMKQLMNSRRAG